MKRLIARISRNLGPLLIILVASCGTSEGSTDDLGLSGDLDDLAVNGEIQSTNEDVTDDIADEDLPSAVIPDASDAPGPTDIMDVVEVTSSDTGVDTVGGETSAEPEGTFTDPFVVAEFPFVDRRDTRSSEIPVFQAYDCEPSADEGGNGFVYLLEIPAAGVLHASLDDIPGDDIDVDVHLLTEPDPETCLIRDNIALSFDVLPGPIWIVVDTWVDGDGVARAGPYVLTLELATDSGDGAAHGTAANPIQIAQLPYTDQRDTSQAPAAAWDRYSCAPGTDESGGELVYRLSLPASGTLTLELDDEVGDDVDPDLHLLSAADPDACVARDNVALSERVSAGTWWIAVDTWVDDDGDAKPGPYTLSVAFEPDAPPPSGVGTLSDPILIDSFPFTDARSTLDATSRVLDGYACAPGTDEGGAEFVYRLIVGEASVLVATVDDVVGDGVDVDLHLLTGPSPSDCIARDNRSLAVAVTPGSYYLVVDTWVDNGGQVRAGPYSFDVSLVPAPDTSDGCFILYGDTRGGSSTDPQPDHRVVTAAIAARCPPGSDLIHTGDFVRSGSSSSDWATFMEIERSLLSERTLWPARGNHDGSWSNLTNRLRDVLPSPPPESRFVRSLAPGLWLIVLDSEADAADQASFLRDALTDPARASDRFIVSFHRPLYPSIGGHSGWSEGKTHWAPIFRQHAGRVLVATGHNHGLSREIVDGVDYVTAGGGGAPLYGCGQAHAGTRFCGDSYGYFVCDRRLRCQGWQVDTETGDEELRDAFVLP